MLYTTPTGCVVQTNACFFQLHLKFINCTETDKKIKMNSFSYFVLFYEHLSYSSTLKDHWYFSNTF